ncbi:MAG TPA: Xaa-Pro peptidase family protein [Gemmatimonadaceae bacterium]|nr:Xaa-Pro peptidase family protein [Gemmatimonadaceae bacterium]
MKLRSLLFLAFLPSLASGQITNTEYTGRRAALAQKIQNGIVVALGSPEPEEDFILFNQNSNFRYLTGFNEPEAALVMVVRNGAIIGSPILFVQPADPAREVWTGHRLGVDAVKSTYAMEGRPSESLAQVMDTLLSRDSTAVVHTIGSFNSEGPIITRDDQIVAGFAKGRHAVTIRNANGDVAGLRRVKTAPELDLIRRAVNVTVAAHKDAMRLVEPGMNEFEVQALIEYDFRRNGADRPSFSTIVGSGPNSTTLHYGVDDRFIENNDVIVMDIGASYRGYAADVTRTIPANGTFSPSQREIYTAVRTAQAAAERAAKVNGAARALSDSANASLDASLTRLGLIESVGATFDCDAAASRQCSQRSLYYMHGLGHGIGLDVHDPGAATGGGTLVPGSAFTIEPGIYVRGNLLDIIPRTAKNQAMIARIAPAVRKYANIGVRIEDDYIVTPGTVEWISRAPREIAEIEAIMKEKFTGPSPRDAATVEAYRSTGRRAP